MSSIEVPTFPKIEARTHANGSGEVTINGTSYPIETTTLEDARAAILARVAETAGKMQRPVRVTTTGPDGEWPLIVHPDGSVEADDSLPAHPAPVEEVAPEPEPLPEPAPAPIDSVPAHAAPPVAPAVAEGNAWVRQAPVPAPEFPSRREARQSFLTQEQIEEPATQGWRGTLTRFGIRMSPSESERAERSDVLAVSQHWPGPRTIAVVNGKGGAGKTPTTVLLAAVFARHGGAGVLTWDNNQTRGTLGWRTEQGPHEATLLDLLPQVDRLLSTGAQSADLAHFVHHQTRDRFDVLRSKPMALAHEQRVEPSDVDAIHAVAAKYYRQDRAMAWLLVSVIVALLVVTALGIVGLASFWVQQRTKQIGVRRALGATRGQILRYFQTENFLLATIGIVLGMLLAYAINQLLMGKYELPRLPLYYLPVGAALLWLLGQVAVYGPARKAASVPPAVATRSA